MHPYSGKGEREEERKGQAYIEFPQNDIELPPTPRLALAQILGSHGLGPKREVLLRVFPHVGSVAGMESELLKRGEHC